MKQSQFFTRSGANKGAKLTLNGPDGKPTDVVFDVYGVDSDVFRRASSQSQIELLQWLEQHGDTPVARASDAFFQFAEERKLKLRASLVFGWTFDEPCTPESVCAFFKEAPDAAQQVDVFASKRDKFVES